MNELGNTSADKNYKPSGISKSEARIMEKLYNLAYKRGYEQAEKDLALTWEDMQLIWQICDTINDTDRKNPDFMCSSRTFFSEVLKRFKEMRHEK